MEKRKNYFIDKKFQAHFILRFCLLVVVTGTFIMAVLYALSGKATTVSFMNLRVIVQSTADFIFPLLVQTLIASTVIVGLATIVITLFVSHRIAGPSFRYKKVLETLGKGDFSLSCKTRPKDSLKDVATGFNDMIGEVRTKLGHIDKELVVLKGKLESGDLKEIKKSVSEVEKALHSFKF
ncbi:MAG: methyl-accepting chemotaxis protein [Candidatus Omnitrophota bacterium]